MWCEVNAKIFSEIKWCELNAKLAGYLCDVKWKKI
jgi:hypothetical protein